MIDLSGPLQTFQTAIVGYMGQVAGPVLAILSITLGTSLVLKLLNKVTK